MQNTATMKTVTQIRGRVCIKPAARLKKEALSAPQNRLCCKRALEGEWGTTERQGSRFPEKAHLVETSMHIIPQLASK